MCECKSYPVVTRLSKYVKIGHGGDQMSSNNYKYLRLKLEKKTYEAVAKIINKQNITIQEILEEMINNFILENIHLLVGGD